MADHFEPGEQIEAAVEPPAIGNAVDMPANEERSRRSSLSSRPEVARFVAVAGEASLPALVLEPSARLLPCWRKGDALRTEAIAGKRLQLPQVGYDSAWIERRRGHASDAPLGAGREEAEAIIPLPF